MSAKKNSKTKASPNKVHKAHQPEVTPVETNPVQALAPEAPPVGATASQTPMVTEPAPTALEPQVTQATVTPAPDLASWLVRDGDLKILGRVQAATAEAARKAARREHGKGVQVEADGPLPVPAEPETTRTDTDAAVPTTPDVPAVAMPATETASAALVAPSPEPATPVSQAPAEGKKPRRARAAQQAASTGQPPKLSALNAAAKVLGETGQAMSCKEMIDAMAAKGYWTSVAGRTPDATLYSAILREMVVKADQARFVKTQRGKFARRNAQA